MTRPTLNLAGLIRAGLFLSAACLIAASTKVAARPDSDRSRIVAPVSIIDNRTRVDANLIDCFVTNDGSFGFDRVEGNSGLFYPRGTPATALFAAGLWLGARVEGETRVVVAEYSSEFAPGTIENGAPTDPWDPSYRVYKIESGDSGSNIDYAEWPIGDGAPVTPLGAPRHLADQTLWSVYNDLDPDGHSNDAGNSAPLGVEIQQTAFALDQLGSANEIIFLEWKIIHKGTESLEDVYLSVWADPDLGDAVDDFVGCDPPASLGFCYNAADTDAVYGSSPPAIGIVFLQGPIVPSPGDEAYVSGRIVPDFRNLELTSFNRYVNGTDPSTTFESYNYMQGLLPDGAPLIDPTTGNETRFAVSGDPVTGSGWVDSDPADRRMMLSVGPVAMSPGDTQVIAVAIVMGRGADRLSSVMNLRENASDARTIFRSLVEDERGACCFSVNQCSIVTAAECAGVFIVGESCEPSPCFRPVAGACCFPNLQCSVVLAEDCGGIFQGPETFCDPNPCAPAACCLGDGHCALLSKFDCEGQGGIYLADSTCELIAPGADPDWERNNSGNPMIDEIRGPGGVPIAADGEGGPGGNVWHNLNSTGDWLLSSGGPPSDGSFEFFRFFGMFDENLLPSDVILRWDNSPDNYGWWSATDEAAQIPFGLYLQDPVTKVETRLIVILSDGHFGGTSGVYEISSNTPDPFSGWPGTDRASGLTGDYEAFAIDAADGTIEYDHRGSQLFTRLIFASENRVLPAEGTTIRFTTSDGGPDVGSGFDLAVPLAWTVPGGIEGCLEGESIYEIFEDGSLIATTSRQDFLHLPAQNGAEAVFEIRIHDPVAGQMSEFSLPATATPRLGGYHALLGDADAPPILDGVINDTEWQAGTLLPASGGVTVRAMADLDYFYLAFEDRVSTEDVRVYIDANGNGTYDADLSEGVVLFQANEVIFSGRSGVYPDVVTTKDILDPPWADFAATETSLEVRLALDDGPLAERPGNVLRLYLRSISSQGSYPPGPQSVLEQAPGLFATLELSGQTSSTSNVVRVRSFPNPMANSTTIAYRIPSPESVSVNIYGVGGRLVRSLQKSVAQAAGVYAVIWDGRTDLGMEAPSGIYFYRVRGESFEQRKQLTLIR